MMWGGKHVKVKNQQRQDKLRFALTPCLSTLPLGAFPLALIFNISLNEGRIPDDRKRANVVPIHKSGDIASTNYCRHISFVLGGWQAAREDDY